MLMKMRCDPNVFNSQNELPIHLAAAHSLTLVKCVTCASQNVNAKDNAGDTPLHIACRAGKLDIVDHLIEVLKCETGILNNNKELSFHYLCEKRHINMKSIKKYVPKSLIDTRNKDSDTPLHKACKNGNEIAVSGLIELNASTDVQNNIGATPLHYACAQGSLRVVQLVHDCSPKHQIHECTVFKYISVGDTALHVACRAKNSDVVRFLLTTKHKDALTVKNESGDTPLHVACSNHLKSVKAIAKCKSILDPNAVNQNQDTPLHIACKKKEGKAIVSYLVKELHCRCDIPNKDNDTPLHIACRKQVKGMIEVLAQSMDKCHLQLQNLNGDTALHELFCKPPSKKLNVSVTKLMTVDMENIECNSKGELPIHLVCRNAPLRIIKCFGPDTLSSSITKSGNTILHEACANRDAYVLEYILKNSKLDANITNCDGDLPLHIACRCHLNKHYTKRIRYLVDKTSIIDVQNKIGNTPIHELYLKAVSEYNYNRLQILRVFLAKEVNLSLQNDENETPLHCICKSESRYASLNVVLTCDSISPINATIKDAAGDTILHIMCRKNDSELVNLLLSSAKVIVDLSIKNKLEQTPLMLTNNPEIIKCLLAHGADPQPVYKMHKNFFSLEQPPPVPVKLLFIGHSGAGKTSLTITAEKRRR